MAEQGSSDEHGAEPSSPPPGIEAATGTSDPPRSPASDGAATSKKTGIDALGPDSLAPPPIASTGKKKPPPAKWGEPIAKVDAFWTRFEVRLAVAVVVLQIAALTAWAALRGLSTGADGASNAGLVFRALAGALAFGFAGHYFTKKKTNKVQYAIAIPVALLVPLFLFWLVYLRRGERIGGAGLMCTVFLGVALFRFFRSNVPEHAVRWGGPAGIAIGLLLTRAWGNALVDWSSNLLNWYQQASSLTLLGGLRGVGTRLTLLLAFLGGSLATAAGKHIAIDVITRFMPTKIRTPMFVAGWLAASAVCGVGAWGFFDHISIENFGAPAEATPGEKFKKVGHGLGENTFILRKQIVLDFKSLPHVLKGEVYSDWLSGAEWNNWVAGAGFVERYGAERSESLKIPDDVKRSPIVIIPGQGEPRGELIHAANLVVPFGLLIMAIRFLVLCLLTISGHRTTEIEDEATEIDRQRDAGSLLEDKPS